MTVMTYQTRCQPSPSSKNNPVASVVVADIVYTLQHTDTRGWADQINKGHPVGYPGYKLPASSCCSWPLDTAAQLLPSVTVWRRVPQDNSTSHTWQQDSCYRQQRYEEEFHRITAHHTHDSRTAVTISKGMKKSFVGNSTSHTLQQRSWYRQQRYEEEFRRVTAHHTHDSRAAVTVSKGMKNSSAEEQHITHIRAEQLLPSA